VPETDKLVDIKSVNLNIRHDIRYATTNNFLKKKIYFDAPGWDKYGLLDIPLENIR
jgi:D-alanyl-D-alanine dipeptidase